LSICTSSLFILFNSETIIIYLCGYSYSGPTAAFAYSHVGLAGKKCVFVIGPSHVSVTAPCRCCLLPLPAACCFYSITAYTLLTFLIVMPSLQHIFTEKMLISEAVELETPGE
jgi:predicted class III extradiol MEMO1 family dioxygenase